MKNISWYQKKYSIDSHSQVVDLNVYLAEKWNARSENSTRTPVFLQPAAEWLHSRFFSSFFTTAECQPILTSHR